MGSIFDFPAGVDLAVALPAERLLRAAGLSRRAALALISLGVLEPRDAAALPWRATDDGPGLEARLRVASHAGPAIVEEIRRWREVPWAD